MHELAIQELTAIRDKIKDGLRDDGTNQRTEIDKIHQLNWCIKKLTEIQNGTL